MNGNKITSNLCLLLLAFIISTSFPAYAMERLAFDQKLSTRLQKAIKEHAGNDADIARIDLNQDGIDEFIVRHPCPDNKALCEYLIFAESEDKIIGLGHIEAKYLMIGNSDKHGKRYILAFKDENNDYDYDLYLWEPITSQYILKE